MKFSQTTALAIAALNAIAVASPNLLARRDGQCPIGYTMSTYYVTVAATSSPVPALLVASPSPSLDVLTTITVTSTSTATVTYTETPVSSTAVVGVVSAISTPVSTSETAVDILLQQKQPEVNAASETTTVPATTSTSLSSALPVKVGSSSSAAATTASVASGQSAASSVSLGSSNSGQATFYGGNVAGGTCSFTTYTLPSGILGTALSDSNWDNAGNCGACVSVTGPSNNSIKAMIVDQCPGCGENHLDLFEDAFTELAAASVGVIDVTWEVVECGIDSPLTLVNKDGTSQYWFSMQVVNANVPVQSLEVSTDGGNTWQSTTRTTYNFFEQSSGFGIDTVNVRVTSITGKSIVVNDVSVASSSSTTATSNF